MKVAVWITIVTSITTSTFSQDITHPPVIKDKQYYQSKSSEQLVIGSILFVGGISAIAIASAGNVDLSDLPILIITGGAATVGGIAVLISSVKSRKKARAMNAFFKMETAPVVRQCSVRRQYFPSLTVNIRM